MTGHINYTDICLWMFIQHTNKAVFVPHSRVIPLYLVGLSFCCRSDIVLQLYYLVLWLVLVQRTIWEDPSLWSSPNCVHVVYMWGTRWSQNSNERCDVTELYQYGRSRIYNNCITAPNNQKVNCYFHSTTTNVGITGFYWQ